MPQHDASVDGGIERIRTDGGATLERVLLDLAVGFVNVPAAELDVAIGHTLAQIGALSGAARTYLFTYDWDRFTCSNTHEWCAPGVEAVMDELQDYDVSSLHDWVACHRSGREVYRPDTTDPSLTPLERELWEFQGITALLTIPLMRDGEAVGFVGFDAVDGPRAWSAQDRELLTVLAELLSHALERMESERLRQEAAALQAANEQLSRFAGVVAHDLKAPLGAIHGLLTVMRQDGLSDHQRTDVIERAIAASGRMSTLIDRLLDYAAAGRDIGDPRPVELSTVVATALEQLTSLVRDRAAQIEVADPLPTVIGDELRLTQVVQNLIGNAVAHAPQDHRPTVWLAAEADGEELVDLTVRDDGPGIAPAQRPAALKTFERGAGTPVAGAGIGLPLCHRIVVAHGGTMELGTAPQGGLEVRITLPAADGGSG